MGRNHLGVLKLSSRYFNGEFWTCPACGKQIKTKVLFWEHRKTFHKGFKRQLTEEEKELRRKKLSDAGKRTMKKRLEDGTWCGWTKRPKGKESYAETFIRQFLQRENLYDLQELKVGRYFIDFAWPKKMLALEIDGHQHTDLESRMESDKRKDEFLKQNGWKVLRLRWSEICKNTQDSLSLIKDFVKNACIDDIGYNRYLLELKRLDDEKAAKKAKTEAYYKNMEDKRNLRWKQIQESKINFQEFGWKTKISKIWRVTPQVASRYIKRNFPDFFKNCK